MLKFYHKTSFLSIQLIKNALNAVKMQNLQQLHIPRYCSCRLTPAGHKTTPHLHIMVFEQVNKMNRWNFSDNNGKNRYENDNRNICHRECDDDKQLYCNGCQKESCSNEFYCYSRYILEQIRSKVTFSLFSLIFCPETTI